jgi:hypothetical protein
MRLLLILVVALFAAHVCANSVPRRDWRGEILRAAPLPGHSLKPRKLSDNADVPIEMLAEQVDLTLVRGDNMFFLVVDATFTMRNHGEAHHMGVAYPIGVNNTMQYFSAETEGVIHDHVLRSRKETYGAGRSKVDMEVWWYEWEFTFPARQVSMHKVKYRMAINTRVRTGYTVSTGGPWKDKISKSVVTLNVAEGMDWGYVQSFGPLDGAANSGGRVVWNYADYDPGTEHDIFIQLNDQTWSRRFAAVSDDRCWEKRAKYCALRRDAHYGEGLVKRSAEQEVAYAESLVRLINEAKAVDDDLVLPRQNPYMRLKELPCARSPEEMKDYKREYIEAWCDRTYIREGADGIFVWLPDVLLVAKQLGPGELTESLLDTWIAMSDAAINGKLRAEDVRLRLSSAVKPVVHKRLASLREQRAALVAAE